LLAIGLRAPIPASLELAELIVQIQSQGALAVAAYPHTSRTPWGRDTLLFWEQHALFAPVLDAWEIASRRSVFVPAATKPAAFIANSDFHKPKHIHSWKTLLRCERHHDAIKQCIRENEGISLTIYKDGMSAGVIGAETAIAISNEVSAGRELMSPMLN